MSGKGAVEKAVKRLVSKYGLEAVRKALDSIRESKAPPQIRWAPNPDCLKGLICAMAGGKALKLEDAWKIVKSISGTPDVKRTHTLGLLRSNVDIFIRVSKKPNHLWKLTEAGEELAKYLCVTPGNLTEIEKNILAPYYLNDPVTRAVYEIFHNKKITRRKGVQLLAERLPSLGYSPKEAEYFIGEKTTALVRLGLLRRKRGKETIYW